MATQKDLILSGLSDIKESLKHIEDLIGGIFGIREAILKAGAPEETINRIGSNVEDSLGCVEELVLKTKE